jgi:predicted dehydrogenase
VGVNDNLRIAVIGAGDVGMRHLQVIESLPGLGVVAIVDPAAAAQAYARQRNIPHFPTEHERMLDAIRPDAALIATPNAMHLAHGLACIERGIPVLMEKPITDTLESALKLIEAADGKKVPVLVAHHRRYNPIFDVARDLIASGDLGRLITVHGSWFRRKPDDYFNARWRRERGGGPLLINFVHDLDCLRVLCGEIRTVQAVTANAARGLEVEDTAAILLQFRNGALGTFILSDAVEAPWGWEQCAGENASWYPQQPVDCYTLGGTAGSLTLPSLELWWNKSGGGRGDPILRRRLQVVPQDPHVRQWQHFAAVVKGMEQPKITAIDATRTLAAALATFRSAETRMPIELTPL